MIRTRTKTNRTSDKHMDELVQRIRWAYILARRRNEGIWNPRKALYIPGAEWDSRRDQRGRIKPNIWMHAANAFSECGIDSPEEYVQWIFRDKTQRRLLEPNQLYTQQRLHRFVKDAHARHTQQRRQIEISLGSQVASLELRIAEYIEYWEDSLKDGPDAKLDYAGAVSIALDWAIESYHPLFIYVVAKQQGLGEYVDEYMFRAAIEYIHYKRYYDDLWRKVLTEEDRHELIRVYRRVCLDEFRRVDSGYA